MKKSRYWAINAEAPPGRNQAQGKAAAQYAHYEPQLQLQTVETGSSSLSAEQRKRLDLYTRQLMVELCRRDERLFFVADHDWFMQ